jgi:uncharacterized membrane protein YsdA (DUF1294 family)
MEEQLYQDFTTKLLPKIAEGLVITKDYFLDLFARYIKYLIISDSFYLAISLIALVGASVSLFVLRHKIKEWSNDYDIASVFVPISLVIIIILSLLGLIINTNDLIKDIYIPEIRVYQSLQNLGQ